MSSPSEGKRAKGLLKKEVKKTMVSNGKNLNNLENILRIVLHQ